MSLQKPNGCAAILGDSHATSLKFAFNSRVAAGIADEGDLVWFVLYGSHSKRLQFENGQIECGVKEAQESFRRSSGGNDVIRLAEYTTLVFCGLNFSVMGLLQQASGHLPFEFMRQHNIENHRYAVLSKAGWRALARDAIVACPSMQLVNAIRKVSRVPILIIPNPA